MPVPLLVVSTTQNGNLTQYSALLLLPFFSHLPSLIRLQPKTITRRPGQEAGNVPYVEEAGFGSYSGDPTKIANTVSTWLETPEMLSEMKGKALDAARPSATLDIARDIAEMLFEKKREDAAAPSA
mmetsp:Transcript_29662/g.87982  ORF Transcript_29662/g.87982 Transcript_29662/m.87982 type:complete len:126 (-) Transcript_29662:340-717(-)